MLHISRIPTTSTTVAGLLPDHPISLRRQHRSARLLVRLFAIAVAALSLTNESAVAAPDLIICSANWTICPLLQVSICPNNIYPYGPLYLYWSSDNGQTWFGVDNGNCNGTALQTGIPSSGGGYSIPICDLTSGPYVVALSTSQNGFGGVSSNYLPMPTPCTAGLTPNLLGYTWNWSCDSLYCSVDAATLSNFSTLYLFNEDGYDFIPESSRRAGQVVFYIPPGDRPSTGNSITVVLTPLGDWTYDANGNPVVGANGVDPLGSSAQLLVGPCTPEDNPACKTLSMDVSTGEYGVGPFSWPGNNDYAWNVVEDPLGATAFSSPQPSGVFSDQPSTWGLGSVPNSQWIGPSTQYDAVRGEYIFERSFCVDQTLDTLAGKLSVALSLLSDDISTVFIYDPNNKVYYMGTTPNDQFPVATQFSRSIPCIQGTYRIDVSVWNTGGAVCGFDLGGTISMAGTTTPCIVSDSCCSAVGRSPYSGYFPLAVFCDFNHDGKIDTVGKIADIGLPGWSVKLIHGRDTISKLSDKHGRLFFTDVPVGTYTVEEEVKPGYRADSNSGPHVLKVQAGWNKEIDFLNYPTSSTKLGVDIHHPLVAPINTVKITSVRPNPARTSIEVAYTLGANEFASLELFNTLGTRVAVLVEGEQAFGGHTVHFDLSGLQEGSYYLRLATPIGQTTQTIKVIR